MRNDWSTDQSFLIVAVMARSRIRPAPCRKAGDRQDSARKHLAVEQAAQNGFASSPNVGTSGDESFWASLRWNWIYRSVHLYRGRSSLSLDDLAHTMALEVVTQLAKGTPEILAYRRAEERLRVESLRDRLCGITGDPKMLRDMKTERVLPLDLSSAVDHTAWSMTLGDRSALATFLRRVLPDQNNGRLSVGRRLLEGVLLEGKSHRQMIDELQISDGAAATARSRGINACLATLGLREHRSYDTRRRK